MRGITFPGLKTIQGLKDGPALRKIWMDEAGHDLGDLDDQTQDAYAGIDADLIHRRRENTTCINLLHVKRVIDHWQRLPEPGETFHAVLKGTYPLFAAVPGILSLSPGQTIERLYLLTLGFGKDNGAEMCELLDAGRIKSLTLICSHYFAAASRAIYGPVAEALAKRGQRVRALRAHAKIIAARLSGGTSIVIESSANLRSCKNLEQATLTNDNGLFDFHAGWIETLMRKGTR